MSTTTPIHVVHLLYRFAAGGMENVLVQLINHLPRDRFRHTVVALTTADPAFIARIERDDVEIIALNKPPGQPFRLYPKVFALLRRLRPDVLHSCNLAALEFAPLAALAGIPRRVHAEHGWDVADPDGSNPRYRFIRRACKPFVSQFVAVSAQLHDYLASVIGVAPARLQLIPNGVDTGRFRPRQAEEAAPADYPFQRGQHRIVGTVGRLEPIKNPLLLVEAFIQLVQASGVAGGDLRLAMVGAGPLAEAVRQRMTEAGLGECLWLPGTRADIPAILRTFDCFVLPSLAEGTSCTLQEAMASALPIVVTNVGGNAELLKQGELGMLVPSNDPGALAHAIGQSLRHVDQRGAAARAHIERHYALPVVIDHYRRLFGEK